MSTSPPLDQLDVARFDAPAILKKLASASRALAELKGVAASIPNQGILIELFKDDVLPDTFANPAAKEVLRYGQALRVGFEQMA